MDDLEKQISSLDKQVAVLREGLSGVSQGIISTGKSLEKALELQAASYDRQLVNLTDAYEKQTKREALYVTREAWELQNSKVEEWKRGVERMLWTAVGAISIIGVLLKFLVK